jgi:hypothetical protein
MSLQKMTIEKFQVLAAIELSEIFDSNEKRIGVVSAYSGKSVDQIMAWPVTKIIKEYKKIIEQWNWLPELQPKAKFQAGNRWYVGAKYINEMTAAQLIEIMSYDTKNERLMIENLHMILASLTRECKYYRWAPEPYSGANHAARAEQMRKHATIGDIWGLISFFLWITTELSGNLMEYLEQKLKQAQKTNQSNGAHR